MVGQTQKHTESQFLSDPMSERKKVFTNSVQEGQSSVYDTKNIECTTLRGENAVHFLCTPK